MKTFSLALILVLISVKCFESAPVYGGISERRYSGDNDYQRRSSYDTYSRDDNDDSYKEGDNYSESYGDYGKRPQLDDIIEVKVIVKDFANRQRDYGRKNSYSNDDDMYARSNVYGIGQTSYESDNSYRGEYDDSESYKMPRSYGGGYDEDDDQYKNVENDDSYGYGNSKYDDSKYGNSKYGSSKYVGSRYGGSRYGSRKSGYGGNDRRSYKMKTPGYGLNGYGKRTSYSSY